VFDESGALATAAGVPAVSDATETAVRIQAGRIVARADAFGAWHAAASAGGPAPASQAHPSPVKRRGSRSETPQR
jgi:hypothetical protein